MWLEREPEGDYLTITNFRYPAAALTLDTMSTAAQTLVLPGQDWENGSGAWVSHQ